MSVGTQRRLAAILAADVVGYSRLIRADEEGTLAALKALRAQIIQPKLAQHNGRVVKLMGDGMLAEFPSVVDAVRAAAETQQAVADYNSNLEHNKRIVLRVGINLGDVVIDGDDIYGDGVNVAARLEALAPPGGICVSGAVYEQVRDRIDIAFEDLGEQEIKNIDRLVRVWRWASDDEPAEPASSKVVGPLSLAEKPSIAVLPFDNMSGDPEQEYFSDGIAEDIITALSHLRWLMVIGRNSSFVYKGHAADLKSIGRHLSVDYILEGSVRRAGNRLRVTAQLIDAATGNHLWARRYDGMMEDVFDLQDEITSKVVGSLEPEIREAEIARTARKRPQSLSAYDYVLRAYPLIWRMTPAASEEARKLLLEAIKIDPDYAEALAAFSLSFFADASSSRHLSRTIGSIESYKSMADYGQRAVRADPNNAFAHLASGLSLVLSRRDPTGGHWHLRRALEINPNSALTHVMLGVSECYGGDGNAAIAHIETAMRLSPADPMMFFWYAYIAVGHFVERRYEDCVEWGRRSMAINPNWPVVQRYVIASLSLLGRAEEAREALDRSLVLDPDYNADVARAVAPLRRAEDLERLIDGLVKAGLPE